MRATQECEGGLLKHEFSIYRSQFVGSVQLRIFRRQQRGVIVRGRRSSVGGIASMKGRVVHVVSSEKWFWRVGSVVCIDSCW